MIASALFLPFIGPMLDHHFPERQYGHVHVYLGPAVSDHGHPYEKPHFHSQPHDEAGGETGASSLGGTASGIIYLISDDGMGQEPAAPSAPMVRVAAIAPSPDSLVIKFGHDDDILDEAFIAPPKKPPRVQLSL